MELPNRSFSLVFSYGTVIWIVMHLISSCSGSEEIHLEKPKIISNTYGQAYEGETFNLTCIMDTKFDNVPFSMTWITPLEKNQERPLTYTNYSNINNKEMRLIGTSFLTIANAQKNDRGMYTCIVKDHLGNTSHSKYLMTILKKSEILIYNSESGKTDTTITTNTSAKSITLNVTYRGSPTPSFNWYDPELKLIEPNEKYNLTKTNSSIHLHIKYLRVYDSGVYTLKANNTFDQKELKLQLYVPGKPLVSTENVYVKFGERAKIFCTLQSYPSAVVTFRYNYCDIKPKWPTCQNDIVAIDSTRNSSMASEFVWNNIISFQPDRPGRMHCTGSNTEGITSNVSYVLIGDITENMTIYGVNENAQIAKGDEVIITCAALVYFYTADLDWFINNRKIINGSGIEIIDTYSNYTYKKIIKFKNIEDAHAGNYECRAKVIDSELEYDSKFIKVNIYEPVAPHIYETNLGDQHKRALGQSLKLICKSKGIPKPYINWYKGTDKLKNSIHFLISDDESVLNVFNINPVHEGVYKCVASNRLGDVELTTQLKITNVSNFDLFGWTIEIIVLIAILIISILYLGIQIRKEKEVLRQLKLTGLENFEKGDLEQINPAVPLNEQVDLLPYDRRFEFPRHKLKLGRQLGCGAFGVVLKANAEEIIPEEKETVVAVKMLKSTADNEVIKALVSELKIMQHLGKHLNVVNLLGAVTKNINKREIMIIVEYCRYGNVQKCLLQNQTRFINQIDTTTDRIDSTIVEQLDSAANFQINRNYEHNPNCNLPGQLNEQNIMTPISEGKYNTLPNNLLNSTSNYKPDSTEELIINTTNLVSWAFQVARGMDYLSSRKVLHGDLAARNILLCEANVVKICDFGLARSMYKNDNYKKHGESLLPIKWLALESLTHQIFSTYSDVWSFGIMMWEFFSLAMVPYPDIKAYETLYRKLKEGYRMEKPLYANEELYNIMLECWDVNPERRPLFHQLEKKLAKLLGEEVKSHFEALNEPYLKTNNKYIQQTGL